MFDIRGSKIILSTDELAIPPFKDYYNKAKNKEQALKDIEYIIWRYKWNTPYEAYPEDERTQRVAKDVFGLDNYQPTEEIQQLIQRFNEFQETPGTRLLAASQHAAECITKALNNLYSNEVDLDTAIKITRILKDVGNTVKSLDMAMKQAKAEQMETGRVKGGGVIGLYETAR